MIRQDSNSATARRKLVILTADTVIDPAMWKAQCARLGTRGFVLRHIDLPSLSPHERRQQVREAHVLVIDGLVVDRQLIEAAPHCVAIIRVGDGYDNIDLSCATEHGILCCNQPGIWSYETAEYAFTLGLMQLRRLPQLLASCSADNDAAANGGGTEARAPSAPLAPDFSGLIAAHTPLRTAREITVGVVGFGRIGQAVTRLYGALVPRVLITASSPLSPLRLARFARRARLSARLQSAPLSRTLAESDLLTLHIPMRVANHHLLSDSAFAQMKPTAILVNCARGALVDSDALYRAVTERRIASAALDVTDPDPLPATHPLRTSAHIHITPHFSWYSDAALQRMCVSIMETVLELTRRRLPKSALNAAEIPRARLRLLRERTRAHERAERGRAAWRRRGAE